jgi:hypothetical protein
MEVKQQTLATENASPSSQCHPQYSYELCQVSANKKLLPTNNNIEKPVRNPGLYEDSQFLFYTGY